MKRKRQRTVWWGEKTKFVTLIKSNTAEHISHIIHDINKEKITNVNCFFLNDNFVYIENETNTKRKRLQHLQNLSQTFKTDYIHII